MRQRRVRPVISALPVVAAALCAVLPLAPWTARNWHTFHVFQPLAPRYANDPGEMAPLGFARWYRTWAIEFASTDEVYWNLNGDRIDLAALPQRAFDAGSPAATQTSAAAPRPCSRTTTTPAMKLRPSTPASTRSPPSISAPTRSSTTSVCPSPACSTWPYARGSR